MNDPLEIGRLLVAWFDRHRRLLPWRVLPTAGPDPAAGANPAAAPGSTPGPVPAVPVDPYRVWVSEVMLQQTRVETIIPYFLRWMDVFPDIHSLAESDEGRVLKMWEGLGYYSRARNLHRGARLVVERYGGRLPEDPEELRRLPGVGEYIAAAVSSIAFGRRVGAVDGNVIRVTSRLLADSSSPADPAFRRRIRALVEQSFGPFAPGWVNQAWMELGALVCRPRPVCAACPLAGRCRAHALGRERDFPARPDRRPRPQRLGILLLVRRPAAGGREEEVLLVRRASRGLLGGLWELPNWEVAELEDEEKTRGFLRERGLRLVADTGQEVRHQYSHFGVRFRLLLAEATAQPILPEWEEARWVEPGGLSEYPRPRAHILALRKLGLLPPDPPARGS